MKITIFIIFTSIFAATTSAQTATCNFDLTTVHDELIYACSLTLDNPDGLEVTVIEGDHQEGFTDDDVVGVIHQSGWLNFMPAVLCQRLPNVARIDLSFSFLNNITDESFSACGELRSLSINSNRIWSLTAGAFANNSRLERLDMDNTSLPFLPEGIFNGLTELKTLRIQNNGFMDMPAGAFSDLQALEVLYMQNLQITSLNPAWFENLVNLRELWMTRGFISVISNPIFGSLASLELLSFNQHALRVFNCHGLTNLVDLNLASNRFTEISEESFISLTSLASLHTLDLSGNNIATLTSGAFIGLTNLQFLNLGHSNIQRLRAGAFDGLESLTELILSGNNIAELPMGIFTPLQRVATLLLANNRLRIIRRTAFADDLSNLVTLGLNENAVVAMDREVFESASSLDHLTFNENVCESDLFIDFIENRDEYFERLNECFENFEWTAEIFTNTSTDYHFHKTKEPGIDIIVHTTNTINIALTPFSFPYLPMVEIQLGTNENTRSVIRRNQNHNVADMSTPYVINFGDESVFRVTWVDRVILVWKGGEVWPFLAYTMEDAFTIRYFGVKTPEAEAMWTIEPMWT